MPTRKRSPLLIIVAVGIFLSAVMSVSISKLGWFDTATVDHLSESSTYPLAVSSAIRSSASDNSLDELRGNPRPLQQQQTTPLDALALLPELPASELKPRIVAFWQHCQQQQNCSQRLQQLKVQLPAHYFSMLSEFPQRHDALQRLYADSLYTHAMPLADKVSQMQLLQQQAFGEQQALMFATENAQYAYQIALAEQVEQLRFLSEEQQLAGLRDFFQLQHTHLPPRTAWQNYQDAMTLFAAGAVTQQQQATLARHFLAPDEAEKIIAQQQQQLHHARQAEDYRQAFLAFEQQLEMLRQHQYADIEDAKWQALLQEKKRAFRQQYFSVANQGTEK